jgi:uncharacterized membrane protein YqjE
MNGLSIIIAIFILFNISYIFVTTYNAFGNDLIDSILDNFLDPGKRKTYNTIVNISYGLSIGLLVMLIVLYVIVSSEKKYNILYFWLFVIIALSFAVYYAISSYLLLKLADENKEFSAQGVLNSSFSFFIVLFTLIIIGMRKTQKSTSSGLRKSS